ncbi:hypothetical protein [Sediminivirga luteola]|uniref:Uncharacterized protein n=1 Tax=Sediminivirga luteola TaxID=1774748 RepID=A0A8J2TYQ0_9MICO|nr:hypothetical protein [Sediminivirga luteola]MCI2264215.1 hypothetical protein [Sediminivirga luteola]GGA17287.1 hypothetical protein GCM10011333_20470 [Sediminivirga luteola]
MSIVPPGGDGHGAAGGDEEPVEGEVVDGPAGASTESEAAAAELATLAQLAARGLYTPGVALGGIAAGLGLILGAASFPAWDGSRFVSVLSCLVAVLLLLCGGYLIATGLAARRAVREPETIRRAFTMALQERRNQQPPGSGGSFERDLIGETLFPGMPGGGRVRNTRALFTALGQLPGRWREYPQLRPFLKPVTTVATRCAIAAGLGIPAGLFLLILAAIAALVG